MNLPIIETPMYTTSLPISGNEIRYRPFLVGEQKALLIAQDGDDKENTLKEIFRLLESCTEGVDIQTLHQTDLEYLFIKLRIVSVGETAEVGLQCDNCEETNEVSVDYEKYEFVPPTKEVNKIQKLTDTISVELKLPSLTELASINKNFNLDFDGDDGDMENPEVMFAILNKMIDKIINGDEVITRDDFTSEELDKFLEGMTLDMLSGILDYVQHQPKMVVPCEFKCPHCEHDNRLLIEGMENFFV